MFGQFSVGYIVMRHPPCGVIVGAGLRTARKAKTVRNVEDAVLCHLYPTVNFHGQFCTLSTPKIKYSSPHISTCEQTVEKWRKPHKIKGLRRFFSGKGRGKCERFAPFFPTFRVGLGSLSPNFPFSGVKLRWKSGRFGGKPIKWGSFPQKVANRDFLLFFMQNFYKNASILG